MSSQKRPHEADDNQPNRRQDTGPPTSGQEDPSALTEELLSDGRDESQLQGQSQFPPAFSQLPSGQGELLRHEEVSSYENISGASSFLSQMAHDDEVSDRLDALRADYERLKTDFDQFRSLMAGRSSPLERSITMDLIERVQALEREAKAPSKRDLLAENQRLSREVETIKASHDEAQTEVARLRQQVDAANVSRDEVEREAERLQEDNRRLEMAVATKTMELANMRSEKDQLARSLNNAWAEIASLRADEA
ncbi:uncharacterized protein FIESC28_02097 [Fusarium coffeatum]|uniref:Uncharacterized protein n=1 Tax=Fusarium coffeatum TaxID=231269 RepID=A0A366S7B9_9HYPO|nr:uncharacterized protein FIESC28_02097 [Fusarium coffeatum]RBR25189.1 hypothetical protein FIESC28_02097 [Fusarium coffeatum]